MAGGVRDTDRGWSALGRALAALSSDPVYVTIGVHGETHSDMVVIAASNEFGTATIPERSYLRSTIDEGAREVAEDLAGALGNYLRDPGRVDLLQRLGLVGEKWVGKVKRKIIDLKLPPNAPSTIARKGSTNPLVDTGRLLNSITWATFKGNRFAG